MYEKDIDTTSSIPVMSDTREGKIGVNWNKVVH